MSEHVPPGRRLGRRRRANVAGGRHHQHFVKVAPEEEAVLARLAAAQGVTVPRLLIESTLDGVGETPSERRLAMAELFAIRRQLAGVANNVNQLARLANVEERYAVGTVDALREIRGVVGRIDRAIDGLSAR